MIEQRNTQDAQLDQNLRAIGRSLFLPSRSAADSSSNTRDSRPLSIGTANPRAAKTGRQSKGTWIMQKPRVFAAFSTALAATIALCAFFIPSSPGSQALGMTSTILRNFREAVHRGLSIELSNLSVEGVHVDGRLQLLFNKPITLAQLADDAAPSDVEPEAVYADIRVRGDDSNDELAGLDAALTGTFAENNNWAFIQIAGLPDAVVREAPPVALATRFFARGMLLDLNGLEELKNLRGSMMDDDADAVEVPADASRPSIGVSADPGGGISIHGSNHGAARASDPSAQADATDDDLNLEQLAQDFLTGKAGAERIAEVVEKTQQVFADVESKQTGPGQWVLIARNIKPEYLEGQDAAILARAALQIEYRQGEGILSAELAPIGKGDGRIRIGFVDHVDAKLLDKQRFIDQGHQPVDVSGLAKMFEGMAGQFGE